MNVTTLRESSPPSPVAESALPFAPTAGGASAWLDGLNPWMKPLSSVNPGEACRYLLGILQESGKIEMTALQRLHLLEVLRPHVLRAASSLDRYFLEPVCADDGKALKLRRMGLLFYSELARNYQCVVGDAGFAEVLNSGQKATAMHRALQSFSLYLLRCHQAYEAAGRTFWEDVYALYRCAEAFAVLDREVADPEGTLTRADTVRLLAGKLAVFHLANPLMLTQRQIGLLFSCLDDNVHCVGLSAESAPEGGKAAFFLNLDGSAAPQHQGNLTTAMAEVRYLSVDATLPGLLFNGSAYAPWGKAVAQRLAPRSVWDSQEASRAVLFTHGIAGCSALSECGMDFLERRMDGRKTNAKEELELLPLDKRREHTPAEAAGLNFGIKRVSREEIWGHTSADAIAVKHSCLGFLNRNSATGRAVIVAERRHLRVGEVVSYRDGARGSVWAIVRNTAPTADPERVWAELETLEGDVAPVKVYIEGAGRQRLPALLCTPKDAAGSQSALLPPIGLANGTWLVLEQEGQWLNRRLSRLLESTGCVNHYQLPPAITPAE